MIITCPYCEKKFEIDTALIPQEGRTLQCGSCGHKWFYKIDQETKISSTDEPPKINKALRKKLTRLLIIKTRH